MIPVRLLPLLFILLLCTLAPSLTSALTEAEVAALLDEAEEDADPLLLDTFIPSGAANATPELDDADIEAIIAAEEAVLAEEFKRKHFIWTLETGLLTGYNDNITLSPFQKTASYFYGTEFEIDFEAVLNPRWKFDFNGNYGHLHYTEASNIDDEQDAFATGQLSFAVDERSTLSIQGNSLYLKSYLDASLNNIETDETELALHLYGGRLSYHHVNLRGLGFEAGMGTAYTDILDSEDDYTTYSVDGMVQLENWLLLMDLSLLDYAARPVRQGDGSQIGPGNTQSLQSSLHLHWSSFLDDAERTQLRISPRYRWTEDLHGSYESNHQFRLSTTLKHQWDTSLISCEIGGSYQPYAARSFPAGAEEILLRRKSWFWDIRAEHELNRNWELHVAYREERNLTNDSIEQYTQRVATVSMIYNF